SGSLLSASQWYSSMTVSPWKVRSCGTRLAVGAVSVTPQTYRLRLVAQRQDRDVVARRFGGEGQRRRAQPGRDRGGAQPGEGTRSRAQPLDAEQLGTAAPLGDPVGVEDQRVARGQADRHVRRFDLRQEPERGAR